MNEKILIEALEDMVWQFGYRGVKDGKPMIWTGGLSALESAFDALNWEDPHFIPEERNTCEIDGCMKEIACGTPWDGWYLSLCSDHSALMREGGDMPKIKEYAIQREKNRDPITGILKSK